MIRYLKGKLFKKEEDRVVILTNGVGYEVLIPAIIIRNFNEKTAGEDGDEVELYISYYHPERQPRPMLIGFNREAEREFFEQFITVGDIGPTKAVKLISVPIHQIAQAIEERNTRFLVQIKGLGPKLADKIIAHLYGKVGKYALIKEPITAPGMEEEDDIARQVLEVMVKQLGHKRMEAMYMIKEALKRNPQASSPEEIFEEVYRSQKG
ncbi:MAG: Holliday junction DNA helicase RuvA [Deltaproteobacteria bacterium]|nr:Holliday junction DNA helicase RuvA [Deltaproteobacteria bacterium]